MPLSPFEIGELASRYMDREPLDTAEVDIQRLIVHLDQIGAPLMKERVMAAIVFHALHCPDDDCQSSKPVAFETRLVRLALSATVEQRAHLGVGFPALMAMVEMTFSPPMLARLEQVARGEGRF